MAQKLYQTATQALDGLCRDNMSVVIGGFGLCGIPMSLIYALDEMGVSGLTVISNNPGIDGVGIGRLVDNRRIKKMLSSYVGNNKGFEQAYLAGEIEVEFCPQGTLAERMRAGGAGIPGFYTRTGLGTIIAEGKETKTFDGQKYILERGIFCDLALVKAEIADEAGNLIYRKTARNFNPMAATASKMTIAEAEEIVPVGELNPDHIHTPGIFIQRLIKTTEKKQIEFVNTRPKTDKALTS